MILIRDSIVNDAVLGSLLIGGTKICDTLEPKDKLIPCGAYKLSVSRSPKFKRDLALVFNDQVPATRGIRMHAGNSSKDSSGCVLVGFGRVNDTIINSRTAETAVTALARNDPSLIITTNGMI
jgi:hypothetical protein